VASSGFVPPARAAAGAVEKLTILDDGTVESKTIANAHPVGICGSGLLDTLAELFAHGIMDRTGRFIPDGHPGYMDEFIRACFLPHTDLSLLPSVKFVAEKI
jgi:uncharacterized 2Fe-2S/4Fe-4S cluster protein (DUF4445 family)